MSNKNSIYHQLFLNKVANLVAEEFWHQGDLEQSELSLKPSPLMNRGLRHELPLLQVEFCKGVCLPVYKALASLSPPLKQMEEAVRINIDKWRDMVEEMDSKKEESQNMIVRNL